MSRPRVLIVDDHKLVVEGLVRLLGDRYEIVDALTDGHLAVEAVCRLLPDVIVLDLSMPGVSGLDVMRRLRERSVPFKAIVLTMHAEASLAVEALRVGASGYVLKESGIHELLQALEAVLEGRTYLAAGMTKDIVMEMVGDQTRLALTLRQQEVLRLIVRGMRAKEIAATLDLSTRTVEATKYRIMQLLQVRSTAELVRHAIEHQIVTI